MINDKKLNAVYAFPFLLLPPWPGRGRTSGLPQSGHPWPLVRQPLNIILHPCKILPLQAGDQGLIPTLSDPVFMRLQRRCGLSSRLDCRLSFGRDDITFPPLGDEPRRPRVLHRPRSALPLPKTLRQAFRLQAEHIRRDGDSDPLRCVQGLLH